MAEPLRHEYRAQLTALEDAVLATGRQVEELIGTAVEAFVKGDADVAAQVVRSDDEVDRRYHAIQEDVHVLLARQAPVATDLRLITALLQSSLHVERIGDYCVNVARAASPAAAQADQDLMAQVGEMGRHAQRVVRVALDAFGRRDDAEARALTALDDTVDQLQKTVLRQVLQQSGDRTTSLEQVLQVALVARYLERIGDHAVDIGEQALFVVTGRAEKL